MLLGTIVIAIFLFMAVLGVPIAVSLILSSFAGLVLVSGFDGALAIAGTLFYTFPQNYIWMCLPMFAFMGMVGYHSGLLKDVFTTARMWLGRLPGGLAISVEAADAIFAATSGSSISAVLVVGRPAIPVLRESGYSDSMAAGVVAAGGTIASLIPPSTSLVLYGVLVEESVGKLLVAAIIPGIITAIIYIGYILVRCRRVPVPKERFTWLNKLYAIRYLWVVAAIIFAILGGIFFGLCTPVEGAVVGALVLLALALAARRMTWNILWKALRETVVVTGMVFAVVLGAMLLSRLLVISGFNASFNETIATLGIPVLGTFLLVTLVYFILGCFVGATAMLVMTLPIFYPLMLSLGFSGIWFGIICIKYVEMAVITPPVGMNLFAVRSIAPDIPMSTITRGAAQFLAMDLLTIMVFYFFPQVILFLPGLMAR